jgi:hypothetical protein
MRTVIIGFTMSLWGFIGASCLISTVVILILFSVQIDVPHSSEGDVCHQLSEDQWHACISAGEVDSVGKRHRISCLFKNEI